MPLNTGSTRESLWSVGNYQQIQQPTHLSIITTDIFADSSHLPCWKDRFSKGFFSRHSITFCPLCGFTFLQISKVQLSQFLVCSICQSWDSLGLFNKNARKKYIRVTRQPGGPFWEKLCPRSWVPPEVVGQGRYSRHRTQLFPTRTVLGWWMTFSFFPLNFTEFFPNEPEWFRAVITVRSSINWTIIERVNRGDVN